MGLDMYLYKVNKANKEEQQELAYWRKFNALHSWFVEDCADGVDECQPIHVIHDKLTELMDLVDYSLETKEIRLQPKDGFFFGSTDIDEIYWNQLKETQVTLTKVLNEIDFEKEEVWYQASW